MVGLGPSLPSAWVSSPIGWVTPTLLLQCPARGRATEGQDWLGVALRFQHAWFLWLFCGNTSHGHYPRLCWATDPNMVHSSSKGLALRAEQVTQVGMVLVAARPLDTNMAQTSGIRLAFDGIRSNRHQLRTWLWSGHKPRHGAWQHPW